MILHIMVSQVSDKRYEIVPCICLRVGVYYPFRAIHPWHISEVGVYLQEEFVRGNTVHSLRHKSSSEESNDQVMQSEKHYAYRSIPECVKT